MGQSRHFFDRIKEEQGYTVRISRIQRDSRHIGHQSVHSGHDFSAVFFPDSPDHGIMDLIREYKLFLIKPYCLPDPAEIFIHRGFIVSPCIA